MSLDLFAFSFVGDRSLSGGRQASYPIFRFFAWVRLKLFFVCCVALWVWFLDLHLCFAKMWGVYFGAAHPRLGWDGQYIPVVIHISFLLSDGV